MEAAEKSDVSTQEIMNLEFCEKHLSLQEKSGLSRKKYCRDNNIHYTRFLYWVNKVSLNKAKTIDNPLPLVAVRLKNNSGSSLTTEVLCTLSLKSGSLLKIHTMEALSYILERMS